MYVKCNVFNVKRKQNIAVKNAIYYYEIHIQFSYQQNCSISFTYLILHICIYLYKGLLLIFLNVHLNECTFMSHPKKKKKNKQTKNKQLTKKKTLTLYDL